MKRTVLAAAVAALVAGTAQAATTELIIYRQQNFQGDAHVVKGVVNNLEGGFAKDASSLVVKGGYWEVCNQDHFKGDCRVVAEGKYPRLDYILDDRIVSVRFLGNDPKLAQRVIKIDRPEDKVAIKEERREARADFRDERRESRADFRDERREARQEYRERRNSAALDLYGQPDFRGRSVRIEDNMADLSSTNFDGRASSLIVHEGLWQVCTEPGYRGRCETLRPGEYRQLAGLDDRISSIRQLR
jgi:hypothetical protein